jgi:iron(III)-enterobactin esterase
MFVRPFENANQRVVATLCGHPDDRDAPAGAQDVAALEQLSRNLQRALPALRIVECQCLTPLPKDPNRRLPAFLVVAVENGGNDGKNSERGLEYDTMSDRFARFINDEVFPAVLHNGEIRKAYPHLGITDNPWGRATMGCSSGGAAALTMGWFRPDLFRRIIAYSGTFVDQQDDDAPEEAAFPYGAWEYHSHLRLIETSEKKPLRIFTHVSEDDLRANDPEETHHNWVLAGQRTAAALDAKGYAHRFVFSRASRHCDGKVFQQTLADTLVWVWRGYRDE